MAAEHKFTAPTHGASWPAWLRREVREQGDQAFYGRDEKGRRLRVIHGFTDDGRYETRYLPEDGGRL